MRLIDADSINDFRIDFSSYKEGPDEDDVKAWLDEQPTIEAEPVRNGEWVNVIHAVVDTTGDCSRCGEQAVWRNRNKPYAICPNCGAKMDGAESDDR